MIRKLPLPPSSWSSSSSPHFEFLCAVHALGRVHVYTLPLEVSLAFQPTITLHLGKENSFILVRCCQDSGGWMAGCFCYPKLRPKSRGEFPVATVCVIPHLSLPAFPLNHSLEHFLLVFCPHPGARASSFHPEWHSTPQRWEGVKRRNTNPDPTITWMFGPEKERNGWTESREWAKGLLITYKLINCHALSNRCSQALLYISAP